MDEQIKIVTGELFTVATPEGDVSPVGMRELENYIESRFNVYLPEDLEPVWATKQGTLPKRIQSYLYKTLKIKLEPSDVSELGNIAKRHASNGKTVILDFTDEIDWEDGDFGDEGSCFWGSNSGAIKMLTANNAYALRGWKSKDRCNTIPDPLTYESVTGYCRAWVAPIKSNLYVVFNGYGETTLTMARLLAFRFNTGYKRINLSNNGCDDGMLYINGGTAFVIGAWQQINHLETHDLGWRSVDTRECWSCEAEIGYGYEYIAYDEDGYHRRYCPDCCSQCSRCGEWYTSSLVSYHDETDRDLCRQCTESVECELEESREEEVEV